MQKKLETPEQVIQELRALSAQFIRPKDTFFASMADVVERLRAAEYNPAFSCTWTYDEDGPWETGCGRAWEFIDGDVAENGVKYCPFCGGRIWEPKAAGGE